MSTRPPVLVLGSASPRRRELLAMLVDDFAVVVAGIDEIRRPDESPCRFAERLAAEKAVAVASSCRQSPVLAADTVVAIDDECLGKPASPDQARTMLARLSGRVHQVHTAAALLMPESAPEMAISTSQVHFAELPGAWIDRYLASGEPMDKAGAYAIQGQAAAWIRHLSGSYSGVMGLDLFSTAKLLRAAALLPDWAE